MSSLITLKLFQIYLDFNLNSFSYYFDINLGKIIVFNYIY